MSSSTAPPAPSPVTAHFANLADDDAKDFRTYLQEAHDTDLSDIERTGCVSEGKDFKNNHVIVMIPALGLNRLERPETMFRKMLLLFLRKTRELVGSAYSIVYAHTNIDIINQYPLIYKFYSILPRAYKKNLQKMYIIHPNVGIRMFFEFARVFLSHKFYNKLCLLESVLDFQRILPPTQLSLPLRFLRREDEEFGHSYCGRLAPLPLSFDAALGTMSVLACCVSALRAQGALQESGLFRVAGDESELRLVRVRLQYAFSPSSREARSVAALNALSQHKDTQREKDTKKDTQPAHTTTTARAERGKSMRMSLSLSQSTPTHTTPAHNVKRNSSRFKSMRATALPTDLSSSSTVLSPSTALFSLTDLKAPGAYVPSSYSRVSLSHNGRALIVGDVNVLYANDDVHAMAPAPSSKMNERSSSGSGSAAPHSAVSQHHTAESVPAAEVPLSVVVVQHVHTIAQIFKFAIRDLPEPLVPYDVYEDVVTITRQFKLSDLNVQWEIAIAKRFSLLPLANMSTLLHVVGFLREVMDNAEHTHMDANNLGVVFAPTLFRPAPRAAHIALTQHAQPTQVSLSEDPVRAAMEVKLTQCVLREMLQRERLLALSLCLWRENLARVLSLSLSPSLSHADRERDAEDREDDALNPVLREWLARSAARGWTSMDSIYSQSERDERSLSLTRQHALSTQRAVTTAVPAPHSEEAPHDALSQVAALSAAVENLSLSRGRVNLNARALPHTPATQRDHTTATHRESEESEGERESLFAAPLDALPHKETERDAHDRTQGERDRVTARALPPVPQRRHSRAPAPPTHDEEQR